MACRLSGKPSEAGIRRRGKYHHRDTIRAGRLEQLPALATELVRLDIDVLVTVPAGGAVAAARATRTIPIVFIGEPDPVGTGLVSSLARPGGNITGLADTHSDLVPKRLQLLKEVVPSVSRVGVLWNPANPSTREQLKIAQTAAPTLGLTVFPLDVKGPLRADMELAFSTIAQERLGCLLVVGDPTLGAQRKEIAERTTQRRLPTAGPHRSWAEDGLLMSYGASFLDLSRRSAVLVDKILKGSKPADLPVEQPTQFELVINMKTAKALGLTIPASVLVQATQVIE
jgi:ABC-type uncharacterized transport system substrate-binding protein